MIEDNLIIPKGYWMNSALSIVRHYGQTTINGKLYIVLPPEDDLVRSDIANAYITLGRDKIVEMLHEQKSVDDILAAADAVKQEKKARKEEFNKRQQTIQFETEGD